MIFRHISLGLLALLAACASTGDGFRFTQEGLPYTMDADQFLIRAGLLAEVGHSTHNDRLPSCALLVRNNGPAGLNFLVRFEWLSRSGLELRSPASGTRLVHLEPGAAKEISNLAPTPESHRVRILLLAP